MQIALVVITHNRRDTLLASLSELPNRVGLPVGEWETIVVDNNSTDGTAQAVRSDHPPTRLIEQPNNNPCAARNTGAAAAKASVLCFLDDDSLPRQGTLTAALKYLANSPQTALLGGPIHLPNGSQDACALPLVPPACGIIVRTNAFRGCGGFDPSYHMQAEEYELVFRLIKQGDQCQRLPSVVFDHEKTPGSRSPNRTLIQDLRNNLVLAKRHLPEPLQSVFIEDWIMRYTALMRHAGIENQAELAISQANDIHRQSPKTTPLLDTQIETLFGIQSQTQRAADFSKSLKGKRVVIADHCKTIHITHKACLNSGLNPIAIIDPHPAYSGLHYRGLPIMTDKSLNPTDVDGIVLSNINPAQVDIRIHKLHQQFKKPILKMLDPTTLWS